MNLGINQHSHRALFNPLKIIEALVGPTDALCTPPGTQPVTLGLGLVLGLIPIKTEMYLGIF